MAFLRDILATKGHEVHALGPDSMVLDALELMERKNIGAVLIVKGEHLVGIYTERLYAREMFLKGRASPDTPLGAVMEADVLTVAPEQSAEACMALMTDRRVRHLPAMDDARLVGKISIGDLMTSIIDNREFDISQLVNYVRG